MKKTQKQIKKEARTEALVTYKRWYPGEAINEDKLWGISSKIFYRKCQEEEELNNLENNFKKETFFYNFFSEKTGIKDSFDITLDNGSFHIVETGVILEMIEKTKGTERKNIEMIIRKIDFQNGDVNHFLNHLATGIATLYQTV